MKKPSRKRALSGRAQIIGLLMYNEWMSGPDSMSAAGTMARAYERGWRDCMAAARKELEAGGLKNLHRENALVRFLSPLR